MHATVMTTRSSSGYELKEANSMQEVPSMMQTTLPRPSQ